MIQSAVYKYCRLILLFALLFGVGGCVFLKALIGPDPIPPKAHFKSVVIKSINLSEINLIVHLDLENPNDFELGVNKMDYQAEFLGSTLARGTYTEALKIRPHSVTPIKLPLKLQMAPSMKLIERYFADPEKVEVTLDARINFDSPVGGLNVHFRENRKLVNNEKK